MLYYFNFCFTYKFRWSPRWSCRYWKNRNYKKDIKIVTVPNESYTKFIEQANLSEYKPPEERYNPGGESRDFDNAPF